MTKVLVSALAIVSSAFLLSTPAFATKGIDAARTCERNPKCTIAYFDDGSISILMGGTYIECAGPQAECTIPAIRPTSGGVTKSLVGEQAKR